MSYRNCLVLLAGLAACSSAPSPNPPPPPPPPPPQCTVSAVAVSPVQVSLEVGATRTLSVAVTPQQCGALVPAWTSDNAAVATVGENGLVTAVGPGETTVRAAVQGVSGSAAITVTRPPLGTQPPARGR